MKTISSVAALAIASVAPGQDLDTRLVVDGLTFPLWVGSAPGDTERLFVLEKRGLVRIVRDGAVVSPAFLSITSRVSSAGEFGLLGLVFSPEYATDGEFYINYIDQAGHTVIARYTVSADPDIADRDSEEIILQVEQPYGDHNAGWMGFGNDSMLYIPLGDGGGALLGGDPEHRAQDPQDMLGKILRIDVLGAPDPGLAYAIPADNPFVGNPDVLDEIWALGLRNPWRNDFDPGTGDLWIADVGQHEREEINFQPADSRGGENYGWKCREGTACFSTEAPCPSSCGVNPFVEPIHEYDHSQACSITGGVVYRGASIGGLDGTYFFADFCRSLVWSLRYDGTGVRELTDRTDELFPGGKLQNNSIVSFGRDGHGEIYIVDRRGGGIHQIIGRTCRADVNGDGVLDFFDFLEFQDLFVAGDPRADFTGDGVLDFFDFLEFQNAFAAGCP